VDEPPPTIVACDGEKKKNNKNAAGLEIKKETDRQQIKGSQPVVLINN
jgi:hypothetical protein